MFTRPIKGNVRADSYCALYSKTVCWQPKKPHIIFIEIHALVRTISHTNTHAQSFTIRASLWSTMEIFTQCDYLLLLPIITFTIPVSFIIYHFIKALKTKSTKRMNGMNELRTNDQKGKKYHHDFNLISREKKHTHTKSLFIKCWLWFCRNVYHRDVRVQKWSFCECCALYSLQYMANFFSDFWLASIWQCGQ